MPIPAYYLGGGIMPLPHIFPSFSPVQFPNALAAVEALPPRLNKVVWNIHNRHGVALDIILGNLLGILAFVCQGVGNVRNIAGVDMPLNNIVHIFGVSVSGKSAVFRLLMKAVRQAMQDWPQQWEFEDSTSPGIKRTAPLLGLNSHEDGSSFLNSPMGCDFDLQISLRDGIVPVVTRASARDHTRTHKAQTRFTSVVNVQPDLHPVLDERWRKKALSSGFLQRVWMVSSYEKIDKFAIGRYPQAEGGLVDWEARVPELLGRAKANAQAGWESLPVLGLSNGALHVLYHEQDRYDIQLAGHSGPLLQVPAVAARHHEMVCVLATLFHFYEDDGPEISADFMQRACKVADYLVGQWVSIVFPPAPPAQEELDGWELLPNILREFNERNVTSIAQSEIVTLAKNMQWLPQRTKAAIMFLCGRGRLQLRPRILNGRRVEMVELPSAPMTPEKKLSDKKD